MKAIYRIDIGPYSYIGSAKNLRQRINKHTRELRNKIHSNLHMQNVFNKYQKINYIVLEFLSEEDDQFEIEQIYLDCLDFNDKYILNKSFVARGMNSEMAKGLVIKNEKIWKNNLLSSESINKRNQTNRSKLAKEKMSNSIREKIKNDPEFEKKMKSTRIMGGRISSLKKYGYKGLYMSESEYRTYLSETFVEYYKYFGLIKKKD